MQVTALPGGGCNVKFTFADQGVVQAIGNGRIIRVRNIPTRRIARQYEITIRHDNDFESSYSIVDQTPHPRAGAVDQLRTLGPDVETGGKLYDIVNGGYLHFQLFRAGRLVDPRQFMPADPGAADRQPG
jgi:hypothetical protein